ncbi:MAG: TetR/AcrR family transcriptional regulator [Anderseniella sp.]
MELDNGSAKKMKKRLSKNDWLALGIEVLSNEGDAELRIDKLCRKLGVTKGSFYAHFRNRAEFVSEFIAYWAQVDTDSIVVEINKHQDKPAEERLLRLMRLVDGLGRASHDIPVRAWATHDATVAEGVKAVDLQRFEYVRQLFQEMGFRDAELDMRTRLFVIYESAEPGMDLPACKLDRDDQIKLRHAFLTRA